MILKHIFKTMFSRPQRIHNRLERITRGNEDLLIILADPKTDTLVAAYKGKFVMDKIVSTEGKELNVVKKVLKHSLFKKNIETFVAKLCSVIQYKQKSIDADQFFMWIASKIEDLVSVLQKEKGSN